MPLGKNLSCTPCSPGAGRGRGRGHYLDDAELLFLAGNLAGERRDAREAEALYRRLVDGTEPDHFGSVDAGLRPVRGRHNLAVVLLEQGRRRRRGCGGRP